MPFDPSELPRLLNPPQLEAATVEAGPLLVLAGAGSGKTRVITFRIANLVVAHKVEPWRILAVTFTNKAAGEMKRRLEDLLGPGARDLWVSTFHATGSRILRRHADVLGLDPRFVIYDDGDQISEMKRVMKAAGLDPKEVNPRRFLSRVDDAKNQGWTPVQLASRGFRTETDRLAHEMYERYQNALAAANAVDFGDLLLRLVELFEVSPELLQRYQRRFRHVLVDEFQDTNPVQYRLLRMLAGEGEGLCVVGDDDQSIYRWRGADVRNLLSFSDDFPGTRLVKLEQNYRSTQVILDAAHAVISRNPRRMDKRLWTEQRGGSPLELIVARDERDEAGTIVDLVRTSLGRGVSAHEMAVFYRTNAQSRVIEDSFRLARLPYAVVRGRSFYDRAEVKDLASYLRLSVNPRSDQDALRVINKPQRGIGDTTVGRLEEAARTWGVGVVEACARAAEIPGLNGPARLRLRTFADLIGRLAMAAAGGPAGPVAALALEQSGMQRAFQDEGTDDALDRLENVRELVGAAEEFDNEWEPPKDPGDPEAPDTPALAAFLEQIALLGEADEKIVGPKVSLMTLHAAKGLEFEEVFLAGMEENVFPHFRALGEDGGPEDVAEERRLCYVGFTRAKRRLVLSLASARVLFGELRFNAPSRFLGEVPRELFGGTAATQVHARSAGQRVVYDEDKQGPDIDLGDGDGFTIDYSYDQRPPPRPVPPVRRRQPERAATLPSSGVGGGAYAPGARVRHAQFGVGVVVAADGDKVSVRFAEVGLKRVVARFVQPA